MNGFSAAVRLAIRTRAGNGDIDDARCEADGIWLGRYGGQCQHRVARQMGGRRTLNGPANGALLCGTSLTGCHGLCEARDAHMHERGWWLNSWEDPLAVPVMLSACGSGITAWLAADGTYALRAPGVVA